MCIMRHPVNLRWGQKYRQLALVLPLEPLSNWEDMIDVTEENGEDESFPTCWPNQFVGDDGAMKPATNRSKNQWKSARRAKTTRAEVDPDSHFFFFFFLVEVLIPFDPLSLIQLEKRF